ncbi:hypothetical protein HaLaN_00976 [Haematococcus lacustris]|uniref:Uncharacterized protein n=1 Tax=Haematococcus lacustris TaxID=44745 RepID=A0A699YK54_HAELA|nr:hypothetical protein HaLaN_00976 [Haematococcus lacustris]
MQVLIIVLESHDKLRLLPDGTRVRALKDEMHGVIHYPLCASCACAILSKALVPGPSHLGGPWTCALAATFEFE